jgi:ABC-2 type transport system permease protein
MMWKRMYALFVARNTEFFRDRSALAWSILLPVLIIFVFAYAFTDENPEKFKVAYVVLADLVVKDLAVEESNPAFEKFISTRYIKFIPVQSVDATLRKIERHQIDLLIDAKLSRYWLNQTSPNGYIVEKLLIAAYVDSPRTPIQTMVDGDEVRYLDWVIPGVIAMNMMWGALFGIGFVIVRYRKMGVLKRLRATPVKPIEFLTAQIMSRLWLLLIVNTLIFIGMDFFLDFRMYGSYVNLFLVFTLGCICLICCGLLIAARISNEEVANGMLNLISWPMMFLSGVWFSLEGAHPWMQKFALILPLTHVTEAAREIMIDGAGLAQVSDHLLVLTLTSIILLLIGAKIFRWE